MNNDIYAKILEDHKELSSLPQTLSEVIRVTKDESSSTRDLADIIMRDPGLTAKVLRVVNSPFYSARREISTVSQAVMTIGTRAVSALALSTSIYDLTGKWESTIDRVSFWHHSLEVAVAARLIAKQARYPFPEEAFVAGMLHDIGLLVMEKSFPEKFSRLWNQASCGKKLYELEEQTWGTNHAKVGQFLLEQWHLPEVLTEAVGHHHLEFVPSSDDPEMRLTQIVTLANAISKFRVHKQSGSPTLTAETKKLLCMHLNLTPGGLKELEQGLFSQTIEEAKFLEIDLGSSDDLMIEANRLIYRHYAMAEQLLSENEKMQQEIARVQMEKAALEVLKTISATFNHYINNAAATILGRAQLIQVGLKNNEIPDPRKSVALAMEVIIGGVDTIKTVMDEVKNLQEFKTTIYYGDARILDLEEKIKARLEHLREGNELPAEV